MFKKQVICFLLGAIFILSGCATFETFFNEPVLTEPIITSITSEPSGADIYWGEVAIVLNKTDLKTPYVEQNGQEDAIWQDWYYQVKKEGYRDSRVIFKSEAAEDRLLHFDLEPLYFDKPTDSEEPIASEMPVVSEKPVATEKPIASEVPVASPKPDYKYGAYTIVSDPVRAHVVLKETGEYIGRTPTKVRFYKTDKNIESTNIIKQFILKKRGFQPTELTLNLLCDNNTQLLALNNPKAIFAMLTTIEEDPAVSTVKEDPAFSTVKITSEPSGASVYRRGYLLGQTPLEYDFFWKTPSISEELILQKSGYDSKRAVLRSADKDINIVLQPSVTAPN